MYKGIEKFNQETSESELELAIELFDDYVINFLEKKSKLRIAEAIQTGKIKLNLQKNRALSIGSLAEKSSENFDVTKFLLKEAEKTADELISSKIQTYV